MKSLPIDKNLIIKYKNKFFIPYFVSETDWVEINTNSWFRCLMYKYNNINTKNKNICGVDIGCKNFITLYGSNGFCYRVMVDEERIDNILQSNKMTYNKKDTKIKNLIDELHIKTARLICSNFKEIYIGQMHTRDEIDSKKMNTTKENLTRILSHNKFLKTVKNYAKKSKKNIYIVDESFTSKHCGVCGEIKVKFERIQFGDDSERRKYECSFCNSLLHRDVNAARCIIIKNIKN